MKDPDKEAGALAVDAKPEADDLEEAGEEEREVDEVDEEEHGNDGEDGEDGEDEEERGTGGWWTFRRAVVLLAVVTVAMAALGGHYLREDRRNAAAEESRADAVRVASRQAINLLAVSSDNVDAQMTDLVANSTGEFRRQFDGMRKTFGTVVRQGKVKSTGKVSAAAVGEIDADSARVLLALSSTVTNTQTKKPEPRLYRITVDLELKGDRWLVSGMQFVP